MFMIIYLFIQSHASVASCSDDRAWCALKKGEMEQMVRDRDALATILPRRMEEQSQSPQPVIKRVRYDVRRWEPDWKRRACALILKEEAQKARKHTPAKAAPLVKDAKLVIGDVTVASFENTELQWQEEIEAARKARSARRRKAHIG